MMAAGLRKASRRPVYVDGNSTAETDLTFTDAAMSHFSLARPWKAVSSDSDAARPFVGSTRMVDRSFGGRRIESFDGDLLERRRQQPLNVAEQSRVSR